MKLSLRARSAGIPAGRCAGFQPAGSREDRRQDAGVAAGWKPALLAPVLLAIALSFAPALFAETVSGRVLTLSEPLPGCTVTLSGGEIRRTKVSDVEGRYSFLAVPAGAYDLTFELAGFKTQTRDVAVAPGEGTAIEDVEVPLDTITEDIVISMNCGGACSDVDPEDPFYRPTCAEYDLNTTLIESMNRGDASAIELLRQRYKTAFTYSERHRIAAALLGRVVDDREYWNALSEHAGNAMRFAYVEERPTQEFRDWCKARGVDPEPYRWMGIDALRSAAADPRARRMVTEALKSEDTDLVLGAFFGVIDRRDESFLPQIEKMLERLPEHAEEYAMWLWGFRSDAADQVAMKFLAAERHEEYADRRREAECETIGCEP